MPLGPVFNAELLTTSRRPRYYVIRLLYGLILLGQIYLTYQANVLRFGDGNGNLRIRDMAEFGKSLFTVFAVVQAVVILLLTPALVGGAIADEKQRKTLHYLLTSQLTGAEIVIGKLAARLLQVVVLVALGLPVVSLIGLFGGVDFKILLLTYGATLTSIFFLSTASILISVVSRRPREAISLLYILEVIWLIVPTMIIELMPQGVEPWPTIAIWLNPILQYVALTSPVFLTSRFANTTFSGTMPVIFWGMGLQLAYGAAFVILAAYRLRPSYRNEGRTKGWIHELGKISQKRSWFPRPECGDDAMLWKEMYVARTGGLTKVVLVTLGVAMVGIIGYSAFGYLSDAVDELWRDGYFLVGSHRTEFNVFLRAVSTVVYVLWFLGIASSSASGLSSEREEDQWISLISTPLSGREIIRAKMIGPVWGLRLVAYLLFMLWVVGLLVGSIHPFGLLACLVEFAVFTWFLTALGTFFSLRAKNSTRSLASTMALLIFLNGGYLLCLIPFQPDTLAVTAGATPFLFAISLMSFEDYATMGRDKETGELILACISGVVLYGLTAAGLTWSLFTRFDDVVDRPKLSGPERSPNEGWKLQKNPLAKEIQHADEVI